MSTLKSLWIALRGYFRRGHVENEMDEELQFHLEMEIANNAAKGMSQREAERAARVAMGGLDQTKEASRDAWGLRFIADMMRDLRLAARSLVKTPSFTIIALVTLALGIGLNTTMFSFVNSIILRPLPYPDSDQLVTLYRTTKESQSTEFTSTEFQALQREEVNFGSFTAFQRGTMNLDGTSSAIPWVRTSGELFDVIGINAQLGRLFRAEDNANSHHHVAVISDGVWRDKFSRASDVIGQTIRGNGDIYEIVGVLSAASIDRRLFGNAGIFTPLISDDNQQMNKRARSLTIIGRRSADISEDRGDQLIETLGARVTINPSSTDTEIVWRSESLADAAKGADGRGMVYMLMGLSTCVLIIACSNLANLLMARTIERSHEFSVRLALGSSRFQLITPLAVESAVLAILGGTGALLVARWTSDWLDAAIQTTGGPAFGFSTDWRVLGFAMIATLLTLIFFGTAPAIFASRINVNGALKSGARGSTGDHKQRRFRNGLIVGQFAFTMILLAGAGYFLQGSYNMMNRPHGWNSDQVIQGKLPLPAESYPDSESITAFQNRFRERLLSLPGVESVSLSDRLPFLGLRGRAWYVADSSGSTTPTTGTAAQTNHVSPSYFSVTETPLVLGRLIDRTDTSTSQNVAVISESAARKIFSDDNPLGRRISLGKAKPREWWEIIGVVGDVQTADVSDNPSNHQIYRPLSQNPSAEFTFGVRTRGVSLGAVIESVQSALIEIDPRITARNLMPVDRAIRANTSPLDIGRKILTAFAALGLFLAALGNYGVIARLVALRTRELGIRMALGAQIPDVIHLVIVSGMRLAIIGGSVGLFGAWGLSQGIRSIFPSLQTNSILVLTGATTILVLVAFIASWIPARRAGRIDPIEALRNE